MKNAWIDAENSGHIVRNRGGSIAGAEGKTSHGGVDHSKDVKKEDRSGYVYENKGHYDNLPDTKDDISA
jgi:hypothetical protein